ncbi:MAG: hypothetical protein IKK18_02350 [Clostridia bacterium]|nr:hypothetical protein [Clostridia bacterium]
MKKLFAGLLLLTMLIIASGCSEKGVEKNETVLKYYETSEEYFDYNSTFFDFRLPLYWQGKFVADIFADHEDFYEITSYEENGTGLVFSIYAYDDKSYKKEHKNYRYLGYHDELRKHYIFVYPDEEKYIESAEEVYNNLKEAYSVILYTFNI